MDSSLALDIRRLRKRYGRFEALDCQGLTVPRGCIFGLLGPNGAGKSTMVKSLLTILRPTEMDATMLGGRPGDKSVMRRVGFMPEQMRFPDYLTGRQVILYSAGLSEVPVATAKKQADELLARVGMSAWGNARLSSYSKGMKQRIGIAQALVGSPELVFLDEPTDGVDPQGRFEIRQMIEGMRDHGITVFINSHLLGEVEQMADQVAILAQGRVLRSGSVKELTSRGLSYHLSTTAPLSPELREKLEHMGYLTGVNWLKRETEQAAEMQPAIDLLRASGLVIRELREQRMSLEHLFMDVVQAPAQIDSARTSTPPPLPSR
jgi:ABC-2 type transport system ATP-binding protein